jgi:hypothetical protein
LPVWRVEASGGLGFAFWAAANMEKGFHRQFQLSSMQDGQTNVDILYMIGLTQTIKR